MNPVRRVVLDTSTLVSAALRIGSVPHQCLVKALGASHLCVSLQTLAELEQVLDREKFDRYLDRESRRGFVALIRRNAHLYTLEGAEILAVEPSCRDASDNQFLALALVADAGVLVSSDEDLLVLNPWRGIPILTPAEFLTSATVLPKSKIEP
jgi:putative PIN family toxin of toxin-antitoxin system